MYNYMKVYICRTKASRGPIVCVSTLFVAVVRFWVLIEGKVCTWTIHGNFSMLSGSRRLIDLIGLCTTQTKHRLV